MISQKRQIIQASIIYLRSGIVIRFLQFIFFPFLAIVFSAVSCDEISISTPPERTSNAGFEPIGSRDCISCGERALTLCQENGWGYPAWFGFNSDGRCVYDCSGSGGNTGQGSVGSVSGPPNSACSYEVDLTLNFRGEVCPSGDPSRGDREFDGNGPRVSGRVTVEPDVSGRWVNGYINATWAETRPDNSSITLERTLVARSHELSRNPSNARAPGVIVDRIVSASNTSFGPRVMRNGEEEIISLRSSDPLVKQLIIVGDTGGDDISDDDNCNDDARVKSVVFNLVRVRMASR